MSWTASGACAGERLESEEGFRGADGIDQQELCPRCEFQQCRNLLVTFVLHFAIGFNYPNLTFQN
jgi:hypothetical protein